MRSLRTVLGRIRGSGRFAAALLFLFAVLAGAVAEENVGADSPRAETSASDHLIIQWLAPAGARVELLSDNGWIRAEVPFAAELAVGRTYVFRIRTIVADEPRLVSASIRVLDGLQTPPGVDPWVHPVPVLLTEGDFLDIDRGALVIKVITLERPDTALAVKYPATDVLQVDAPIHRDPMQVAYDHGVPLAVLMAGSRVYELSEADTLPRGPVTLRSAPQHSRPSRRGERELVEQHIRQASFDVRARRSMLPLPGIFGAEEDLSVPTGPARLDPDRINPALLYDGGDRYPPAGRDPAGITFGLDPSDTVGFYSSGKQLRKAVARPIFLFAPRFIAVRTVRRGGLERSVRPALTLERTALGGSLTGTSRAEVRQQRRDVALERGEIRPVVAQAEEGTAIASDVRVLHGVRQLSGLARLTLALTNAGLSSSRQAWLAARIRAAEVWRSEQLPHYTYLAQSGVVVKGVAREEAVVRVEEPPKEPGQIVMWKLANTAEAGPGEIVEFAIYWKNVGDTPVESLSIMDSLLPRLEYVPDSAGSSRGAVFTVGENRAGSAVLRWDISGTIQPGEQGAVWFKARVR